MRLFSFLMKKIPLFNYAIIVADEDDRMLQSGREGQEFVTVDVHAKGW